MKQIFLPIAAAAMFAMPSFAQEQSEAPRHSLMEQGAELFWQGLRQEMAPALDDLRALADNIGPSMQGFMMKMGPALAQIADEVEDWSAYELPEILTNGDIIIRKKVAPVDPDTPQPEADGATDI